MDKNLVKNSGLKYSGTKAEGRLVKKSMMIINQKEVLHFKISESNKQVRS